MIKKKGNLREIIDKFFLIWYTNLTKQDEIRDFCALENKETGGISMRKLISYLKEYKIESLLGPLFKLLEVCFELTVPLIMAAIIDRGIQSQTPAYILKMGGVLVVLGILGLISALTAQYFAAKAAYGFGTALRRALFAHINRLSFSELDQLGTAGLITRINGDVYHVQSGVNLFLRLFMRSPFVVLGALLMAFAIDVKIACIFAVAVPCLGLVIYSIMAAGIPIYKKGQQQLDMLSRITRENLTGVRVIRAFSRQKDEEEGFQKTSSALQNIQLWAGKISGLMNPLTYVLVNISILLIVRQGAGQVHGGAITQGEVIALVNYMTQILLALVALAQLIISLTRASASAARINEVFAMKTSMDDRGNKEQAPIPGAPKVSLEGVSFSYQGAQETVLEDISFQIQAGETVGIIGGTGAGKSTLVNLLPRFYDVGCGTVQIDGIDVRQYPFAQLRAKMGIVPQKAVLFRGTIRENLQWGKKDATDAELYRALEIAQARDFVEEREGGLDALVSQGGKNLSGGQRQRLTIARALVGNPEILILDDSSSALDYATDAKLRRGLSQETDHMTVFIVSQRATAIRHADRILVLDDGRLVGSGTHGELLENCEVYREICLSQLSKEEVGQG